MRRQGLDKAADGAMGWVANFCIILIDRPIVNLNSKQAAQNAAEGAAKIYYAPKMTHQWFC